MMHIHQSCPASTAFCPSSSLKPPPKVYSFHPTGIEVKMGDMITHLTCCRRCRPVALVDDRQSLQKLYVAKQDQMALDGISVRHQPELSGSHQSKPSEPPSHLLLGRFLDTHIARGDHGHMPATAFIRRTTRLARITPAFHELTPRRHRGQCRAQRVAEPCARRHASRSVCALVCPAQVALIHTHVDR